MMNMTQLHDNPFHTRKRPAAFTLTELLVAIALLAVIMLSVTTIFRTTSDTVSAGLAVTDLNRRLTGAQSTLQADIVGTDVDPYSPTSGMWPVNAPAGSRTPFLFIHGQITNAFLDRNEWNSAGGIGASPTISYHTDSIGFFANGNFKRQTGGGIGTAQGQAVSSGTASQAYIWYGHLRLPDNSNNFQSPGYVNTNWQTDNPNNYFASQWFLGRSSLLLGNITAGYTGYPCAIVDSSSSPSPVYYYGRPDGTPNSVLSPLAVNSHVTLGNGSYPSTNLTQDSRYDLVGLNATDCTTWDQYAGIVATHAASSGTWGIDHFGYRFQGNPYLDLSNATTPDQFAAATAQSVPAFLPNCINFTVEFAGDYVAQQNDGSVAAIDQVAFDPATSTSWHLDGSIDFDVVTVNGQQVRQIHWYGVNHPVSDLRGITAGVSNMPFEHQIGVVANREYMWAWSPNELTFDGVNNRSLAPKLIRITIQLVDSQGRLQDGMTRQFIFPVKYQ